jgi:formate dehydrogenase subunit delta
MHVDHLVRMANQIGDFFEAMPDRAEALHGIAEHLRKFWDPRMRRELQAHLDGCAAGADTSGLSATVAEALALHRSAWSPAPAVSSLSSAPAAAPGPTRHQ